jgi:hypothetical protein
MDYWKANTDIQDMVNNLIAQNHPDLAIVSEEIVVLFKDRGGTSGGQPTYGRAYKASAIQNALAGEEFKFVLVLGADRWEHELDERQREALLDHLLCSCRAEEDPKSGEIKLSIARVDIEAFYDNVTRYGLWFPRETEEDDEEAGSASDQVDQVEELITG